MQRKLPGAKGSFMEAQFQSFSDPSAVIHHSQHRAQSRLSVLEIRPRHQTLMPLSLAEPGPHI